MGNSHQLPAPVDGITATGFVNLAKNAAATQIQETIMPAQIIQTNNMPFANDNSDPMPTVWAYTGTAE